MNTAGRIAVVVAALAVAATPGAQQPAPAPPPLPSFRADVNAVQLDVRVVDRDGRFVRGLSRDDFRVTEDGNDQQVSHSRGRAPPSSGKYSHFR